jgi:hypothetical protein
MEGAAGELGMAAVCGKPRKVPPSESDLGAAPALAAGMVSAALARAKEGAKGGADGPGLKSLTKSVWGAGGLGSAVTHEVAEVAPPSRWASGSELRGIRALAAGLIWAALKRRMAGGVWPDEGERAPSLLLLPRFGGEVWSLDGWGSAGAVLGALATATLPASALSAISITGSTRLTRAAQASTLP